MGSLVVFASADLISVSRYVHINLCVNFPYRKNQLLPLLTFKKIAKVCKANVDIFGGKKEKYLFHYFSSLFR